MSWVQVPPEADGRVRSTQTLVIHQWAGPSGSSFFLGKVTALGVLCCLALFGCLTLLASFSFHLSLKHVQCTPIYNGHNAVT